jgi:NAD(P)-dependent dehydrogenase (short-subunit alcohol dehydrogenase family)
MASWVINGSSKGIGFEFLRQLSANPENTVIGLARDVKTTEAKVKSEIGRDNIHILHGDLESYDSMKKAAEGVAKITGGSLDYLVGNGARLPEGSAYVGLSEQCKEPEALEAELMAGFKANVVGTLFLFQLFVPLLLKGKQKKAVHISSGMADIELIRQYDVDVSGPYAVAKAAANAVIAKLSAEYRKDGLLLMSISPGVVDTGHFNPAALSEKELQSVMGLQGKFANYAPHFKGPITPEESVKAILSVIDKSSIENGDGGAFISHLGSKQWL